MLFEQGKPLSVEELDLEPPRAGEVAVRMAAMRRCQAGIVMVTADEQKTADGSRSTTTSSSRSARPSSSTTRA